MQEAAKSVAGKSEVRSKTQTKEKKESKSASKEERSTAFTQLSGHEGKRQKRKRPLTI